MWGPRGGCPGPGQPPGLAMMIRGGAQRGEFGRVCRLARRPICASLTMGRNSECRRAQDAKRDIPVPLSPCARRQLCGPGRPAPGHGAVTTRPLRGRSDSAMTRRRMARRRVGCALHPASTAPGPAAPAPLRRHARADTFRGLPAFASLSMAGSGRQLRKDARFPIDFAYSLQVNFLF